MTRFILVRSKQFFCQIKPRLLLQCYIDKNREMHHFFGLQKEGSILVFGWGGVAEKRLKALLVAN